VLADATPLEGATAPEKARALLKATGVAAVAGSAFFRNGRGENLLRFCFAKQDAALDEACARLRRLRHHHTEHEHEGGKVARAKG
jgi:aminotransferase